MRVSDAKARAVLAEIGRAWKIPAKYRPMVLRIDYSTHGCEGLFHPRTRSQPNLIALCDDRPGNQFAVFLHECSHWVSFEQTKVRTEVHDAAFWKRTEMLYKIFGVTPAEARRYKHPERWKGIRTWL